ncbi:hypothetical protein H4R19_000079 [Coemansia spiralis]|nr:hypothetical protein H4R19_000079 [Coemansia spiralis]
MAKHNWLEFELDQPDIVLRGMADDSPGTVFSGRLIVHLCEPIRVKGLTMALEGHERLEWEYHNNGAISTFLRETTPLTHTWSFFAAGDGRKVETWQAGRHEFPFSLAFPGSMPESIRIPYADVNYQLTATLRRTGFMQNIAARREVQVKRDLTFDGGFGHGAIDVENRWREMMEFRIAADADTFVPGDRMRARLAFQPLVKRMHLSKIGVVLKEYVRCHKPSGHAEKTVSRVVASAEIEPTGCASDAMPAVPAATFGGCRSRRSSASQPAPAAADDDSPPPLPAKCARTPQSDARPAGVDLADALEESIQLTIPAESRRLQYDHISPYVEITHKLKFSIHFRDPNQKPHTLWISVPVSVVPELADSPRGGRAELPTYKDSALDQRVAVAGYEHSPPSYYAAVADSLSRGVSARTSLTSLGTTTAYSNSPTAAAASVSSSAASTHSTADTESLDGSTALPDPACPPATKDCGFFRRPVVFPASAEATPLSTPAASPQLKSTGHMPQYLPVVRAPPPTASASTHRRG